ncbi:MAG: TolC family protein [Phycisphaerales bacterium]|nr:TolC family protein [Phycisphaerales bacterium]
MNEPVVLRRLRAACLVLLALATVSIAGCDSLLRDGRPRVTIDPDRLRSIEPLRLPDLARSSQTVEEAREAFAQRPPALDEPSEAAEVLSLSIEECRALALQYNLDLGVALLNPTITRENITQEEARFESLFFANIRQSVFDQPTDTSLNGSSVKSLNGDVGVRIPLHTGGIITLDLPLNRTETDNQFATLNPSFSSDFSASISQPLLRNAGVRTNTHAIRVAIYQSQISEARTKLEVIRVVADVDRVYWRLYAAQRELEVHEQEYDLAVAQLQRAQRRVKAGDAAEVEIVRAEAGVAQRVEAIIIAQNAVRDSERLLKRVLNKPGLGMETPTVIELATQPNPIRYELEPIELANNALDSRMEMLELELLIAQDSSSIDFARNQKLPLVTLDYRYNVNGLGASFGDSFDVLGDKNFEDHIVGLSVEVPLGNAAAISRYNQAVYERVQRLATKEQRRAQIINEVFNALDQLDANWQRVLAAGRSALLEARLLEAEQRQFDLGLRTSTDVLDAQARYANARSAEIRALAEYQIAQVDIAFATGTLLGSAQVRWEPVVPDVPELR